MECYSFATDRAPDWKWQRMLGIRSGAQPDTTPLLDTKSGSIWICRAGNFYEDYNKDQNPLTNHSLITQYGDIFTAFQFHEDTTSLFRWELEACVLANVEPVEIALNIGCNENAILAYEELFFDVRDRLECPSYIRSYIIGADIQEIDYNNYDKLWKHYAYDGGGYEVLKALIRRSINVQKAVSSDMVDSAFDADISNTIRMAAATISKRANKAYKERGSVIDAAIKIREVERISDSFGGGASGDIVKHIETMFSQLPWRVGGVNPENKQADKRDNAISRYMKTPIELTYPEVVDASIIGESPEAEKLVKLKYPPVEIKKKK